MPVRHGVLILTVIILVPLLPSAQRIVKATDAWVTATADGASAYVVIENGTMYDVFLTRVESEAAETVELRQTANGVSSVVEEIAIPAFNQLAMTGDGAHLKLKGLKRALKAGDTVPLALTLDNGDVLSVSAVTK
jgi:copper(I)-binding protein